VTSKPPMIEIITFFR